MATAVLFDDFTGTTISTTKWVKTDPNNLITQNGVLNMSGNAVNNSLFDDILKSVGSVASSVAVCQANITWTTDNNNEALGGLFLYKDNNNYASISSRTSAGGLYRLKVVTGGVSRYDFDTAIAKAKDVKIWTDGTNIKFYYYNSGWVQLGTTQTFSLGYSLFTLLAINSSTGFTGANPVTIDNVYMSDFDYAGAVPFYVINVSDTSVSSESLNIPKGYRLSVSDTAHSSDSNKIKYGFGNPSKSSTSWTNTSKS